MLIPFNKVTPQVVDQLVSFCGKEHVLFDKKILQKYGQDETEDLLFPPEVVVKPSSPEEIVMIMKLCNKENIPVTPISARTGLSGGALSVFGGVGISMERFNRIIDIDESNLQATVEPGVITQVFQEAVQEIGLFYPPDPASRGSCSIGGNLAENSGGPKAVKYGVTKDYVLNLQVVLPNGEIIWTGANVLKNSTGYNLTQLFVGSEGTLGIITKAVFRLIPYPKYDMLMLVPFLRPEKACEAVSAIFKAGIVPSVLEFMERDAIDMSMKYLGNISFDIRDEHLAHLIIEVDGMHQKVLFEECDRIYEIVKKYDCDEMLIAENSDQKDKLWKLRRHAGEAVKAHSLYKEEDTVVPRYRLPDLLKGVKEIGKEYGFRSVCYGHAGDGNLHINILKEDIDDDKWNRELPIAVGKIFNLTVSLGGTISGEHGIGWTQRQYLPIALGEEEIRLQKAVKAVFDPKNILNPGKIFID